MAYFCPFTPSLIGLLCSVSSTCPPHSPLRLALGHDWCFGESDVIAVIWCALQRSCVRMCALLSSVFGTSCFLVAARWVSIGPDPNDRLLRTAAGPGHRNAMAR